MSVDTMLGLPFNIASYAVLTHLLAIQVGMEADELIASLGDTHIYFNHAEKAKLQAEREPLNTPRLVISENCLSNFHILEVRREDLSLEGYEHHEKINYERNV